MKQKILSNKTNAIRTVKNTAMVILGTFIMSFGTGLFIIPFDLVTGGVSGIAIVLHRIFSGIPFMSSIATEIYASVINWILFGIGWIFLGRSFAAKTLISTAVYPIALSFASWLSLDSVLGGFFNLLSDKYMASAEVTLILATIFGGACVGAGCALTFLGGGSTGGVDVIALIISKYVHRLKSSTTFFICDALIVVLGMFVIDNLVVSLLGIISAFICALSIDKLFLGESGAFIAHIISDKYEEINQGVIQRLNRTTTVMEAVGGYSGTGKKIVMVTFSMRQYADFIALIASIDKNAFVTVHRAHQINGEGWTYGQHQ